MQRGEILNIKKEVYWINLNGIDIILRKKLWNLFNLEVLTRPWFKALFHYLLRVLDGSRHIKRLYTRLSQYCFSDFYIKFSQKMSTCNITSRLTALELTFIEKNQNGKLFHCVCRSPLLKNLRNFFAFETKKHFHQFFLFVTGAKYIILKKVFCAF